MLLCWSGVSGGWHGRRYGYDVGLLGAAGRASRDKPAVAIGVASACRCSGEGNRGGVEVVCCVSQEGGESSSKVQ